MRNKKNIYWYALLTKGLIYVELVAHVVGRKPIMKTFRQNCVLMAKNSNSEHQNTHFGAK